MRRQGYLRSVSYLWTSSHLLRNPGGVLPLTYRHLCSIRNFLTSSWYRTTLGWTRVCLCTSLLSVYCLVASALMLDTRALAQITSQHNLSLPTYSSKPNSPLVPALERVAQGTQFGALFVRLRDNQVLYSYNPNRFLIPASVTKLFTAAAALKHWGSHHRFQTSAWTDHINPLEPSSSHHHPTPVEIAHLYLEGSGDPSLVNEKIWELANALKNRGVVRIAGDIVIDQSLFSSKNHPHIHRTTSSISRHAYDAPLAPLAVNFSSYEMWVVSSLADRSTPSMSLLPYPRPSSVSIQHHLTTSRSGSSRITVTRRSQGIPPEISLKAQGSYHTPEPQSRTNPLRFYRSAVDATTFAGELVRSFLEGEGISVAGQVRTGHLPRPPSRTHLYTLSGGELNKIIQDMNSYSNNFIADMLALQLLSENNPPHHHTSGHTGASGSSHSLNPSILKTYQQILRPEMGLFPRPARIVNGSGLTSHHRLSPKMIIRLLTSVHHDLSLFPDFMASLAVPGGPGTLNQRLRKYDKLRAKTGSLSQPVAVCSLAGYGHDPEHGLYAFAMIHNGRRGSSIAPSLGELYAVQEKALGEIIATWPSETS